MPFWKMYYCITKIASLFRYDRERRINTNKLIRPIECVELMLKEILKDPQKMKECSETARKVIEKRKQKILQVRKTKGIVLNTTARLKSEYDKWKQVVTPSSFTNRLFSP